MKTPKTLREELTEIADRNGPEARQWNRRLWKLIDVGEGRLVNNYIRHHWPEHLDADRDGNVYQHRIVAMIVLGRLLTDTEEIHHRNEIRWDNRPSNLEVCADAVEHGKRHRMSNRRLKATRKAELKAKAAASASPEDGRHTEPEG